MSCSKSLNTSKNVTRNISEDKKNLVSLELGKIEKCKALLILKLFLNHASR